MVYMYACLLADTKKQMHMVYLYACLLADT